MKEKKKKDEQEKGVEVAPPGFETAPQVPPAQIKKSEVSSTGLYYQCTVKF